jgi:hypothetical protein
VGAFFTNVHVRASAGREQAIRTAVLEAVQRLAAQTGLVACKDGLKSDRSIVVGPAGPWVAVLDEATESQDVDLLDGLAKELSVRSGACTLAALVHDSDHLLLRLFEGGRLIDEVDREKKKGHPDRWSSLVPPDTMSSLGVAFGRRDLFAEQTLAEIASLLGLDERTACTGYRYVEHDGVELEGATLLRFRHADRSAHEPRAEGPPKLVGYGAPRTHSTAVGGRLRLEALSRNEGGPSRGLIAVVYGDAIHSGLVVPEVVRVFAGGPGQAVYQCAPERRTLKNGRTGFVADLRQAEIPAGNAGGLGALTGVSAERFIELSTRSQLQTVVEGRGVAAGEATLLLTMSARATVDVGVQHAFRVVVAPATRKPMHGQSADPSSYLALDVPETLVALAMSTLEARRAAPIAAEIVERWSELWPAEAKLGAAVFGSKSARRPTKPRKVSLKVAGLAESAGWKKLRASFATADFVGANGEHGVETRAVGEPLRGGNGFAFGRRVAGSRFESADASDRELLTLRLGVDLRGRADVAELVSRGRALVDEFVQRAQCAQAFLARWRPSGPSYLLDTTPYESACGVHGQCTLRHSWATRFLRGVSADGIWLGPDLLARIDRKALEPVTNAEKIGATLRLVLREGSTLDALEAVLSPILPSSDDWKREMLALRAIAL